MPGNCKYCGKGLPKDKTEFCGFECRQAWHEKWLKGQKAKTKSELRKEITQSQKERPRKPPSRKFKALCQKHEQREAPPKQAKIWLLTWNCGNKKPNDQQLRDLIISHLSDAVDKPDVVVIGVQEFPRKTKAHIHKRVEKEKVGYRVAGERKYDGVSGGSRNRQVLGVLVRSDLKVKDVRTEKGARFWGKGGIIVALTLRLKAGDVRLAFISAHLDSGTKQEEDIDKIKIAMEGVAQKGRFDAVFMMGDLNYRLGTTDSGTLKQGTTNEAFCGMITNTGGRRRLFGQDLLKRKCSLVTESDPCFRFPVPYDPGYPTYRINRKVGNYSVAFLHDKVRNIKNTLGTYCFSKDIQKEYEKERKKGKTTDQKIGEIRKRPFDYDTKREAFNVGWLDRIGWATTWANVLSGKGRVGFQDFDALHKVVMSDHAAVLMKVRVDVSADG